MNKVVVMLTDLVCLECGYVFTIPRSRSLKPVGHIKDLYCPSCQRVTKYYEVKDVSKFIWEVSPDDEVKSYVKNLIINGADQNEERKSRVFEKVLKR